MAGNDVFLRTVPSDADSDDVRLYDPTVADAGGGTEALSGSATLTLTASGALVSTTAFSGAGSLVLTASGSLLSTTALSGAAGLILTATGALNATTSLSGNATLALDATGSLNATTALSGSATLTLDATGDLTVTEGAAADVDQPRRYGGGGRLNRTWRGKYAGYLTEDEWTAYLLAALSAEVIETPLPPKKPVSRKLRRIVVEPEAYIARTYPETFGALLELKIDALAELAKERHAAQAAKLIEAALKRKRREEEDDIAFLLLAA